MLGNYNQAGGSGARLPPPAPPENQCAPIATLMPLQRINSPAWVVGRAVQTTASTTAFDLVDRFGKFITVRKFSEQHHVDEGKVYKITGALVAVGYNTDLELRLSDTSEVVEVVDTGVIPYNHFHFRPLSQLGNLPIDGMMDFLCIVTTVSGPTDVPGFGTRRTLTVVDKTSVQEEASVQMYGEANYRIGQHLYDECLKTPPVYHVVAFKNAFVRQSSNGQFRYIEFGRFPAGNRLYEDLPNEPRVEDLKDWYADLNNM